MKHELGLLASHITPRSDSEDENGLSEKVRELVPTVVIDTQELVGRVEQYQYRDEWCTYIQL